MNFYNKILELSLKGCIDLFVDMDGVIASYDFGKPLDFKNKRPLYNRIEVFKKISEISNVNLHILSICRTDAQIKDKSDWLDKYAPFFISSNRHILSKESIINKASFEMKCDFLSNFDSDSSIILIDDDNQVLYFISSKLKKVKLFQDSELCD